LDLVATVELFAVFTALGSFVSNFEGKLGFKVITFVLETVDGLLDVVVDLFVVIVSLTLETFLDNASAF